jgi:biotin carboxylase
MHHTNSFFPLELRDRVGDCAELVWVVDSRGVPKEMIRFLRRLGPVVDTAGQDLDSVAEELTRLGVGGIASFVDDHIVDAAILAERVGLPYHTPDVAHALVNKQVQRAVLDAAGIPGPAFWSAPSGLDAASAAAIAGRVTYPAVVKPAEGSGSRDICLVRTAEELSSVITAGGGPGHLVEQYLEDERGHGSWYASYLSVESVVSHGTVGHVAMTGRFPLAQPFRETGNFIPAICPAEQVPGILSLVDDTIAALGITDSVTHIEIKLTPDGPRLIEVNGRLGGRPPFVLCGISDTNLFQVACQVALGDPVHIDAMATCDGVGFWLMLHAPMKARRLDAVDGADAAAAVSGVTDLRVNRHPGASLDWREGTDGKIVTIQGTATDHTALAATVGRIRDAITISTDAGPGCERTPATDAHDVADWPVDVLELPEHSPEDQPLTTGSRAVRG